MQSDLVPAPHVNTGAQLQFCLGNAPGTPPVRRALGVPMIAGEPRETFLADAKVNPLGRLGSLELFESEGWLFGWAEARQVATIEAATRSIYEDLLATTAEHGRHVCRIWNYVPAINVVGEGGLENYRAFSRARSLAFENAFGPGFTRELPAASAVGCSDDRLTVVFAAHRIRPAHCENPRQVPAYEYPEQYGPRPPSFARASVLTQADGRRDVFVSGTSAIMGHETIAPGDTLAQTRCTLENLNQISWSCGLGSDLATARSATRQIKVYLRRAGEQRAVAELIDPLFTDPGDRISYVAADICRRELNVEIEASIFGVPG